MVRLTEKVTRRDMLRFVAVSAGAMALVPTPTRALVTDVNTLTVLTDLEHTSFDPVTAWGVGHNMNSCTIIYEGLLGYKGADTKPVPMIAESWNISGDGKVYTFKIRQGVKFHNGDVVDANAVKYSLDRAAKLKIGSSDLIGSILTPERVKVVDNYTLQLRLEKPFAPLLAILAHLPAMVVNPKLIEDHGSVQAGMPNTWLSANGAGSGPYRVVELRSGESVTFERFEDYWQGPARIKRVVVKRVAELATQYMVIKKGDADVLGINLPAPAVAELKGAPGVVVKINSGVSHLHGVFNTKRPPFDDKRVRQALAYATDWEALLETVWGGYALRFPAPPHKGMLGWDEANLKAYAYNPAKAKELLAVAGQAKGFQMEIAHRTDATRRAIATVLQSQWAAVGIKVNARELAPAVVSGKSSSGDFDMILYQWEPFYPDSAGSFGALIDPRIASNSSRYGPPEVVKLLDQGVEETDPNKRSEIYRQLRRICLEDLPYLWIAQIPRILVYRDWVKGVTFNPFVWSDWPHGNRIDWLRKEV